VTGWDFRFQEANAFGRRVAALLRAFNLRCGIGPEVEQPGPRYGSTPHDGPAKGISIRPHWDQMRKSYYEECGYDWETGKPSVDLLRRVGLEELIPALWG
jgi:aldehyde:ferredoxin oxidoreductase